MTDASGGRGGEHLTGSFRHGRRGNGTLASQDAIASLALLIKGTRVFKKNFWLQQRLSFPSNLGLRAARREAYS